MSIDGAYTATDTQDAQHDEQDVTGTLLEILGSNESLENLLCQQSLWHLEGVPHPATGCLVCFGM